MANAMFENGTPFTRWPFSWYTNTKRIAELLYKLPSTTFIPDTRPLYIDFCPLQNPFAFLLRDLD